MIRFIFCLSFLVLAASISFALEDIVDLGEVGFTSSVCHGENKGSHPAINRNAYKSTQLNTAGLSYKGNLARHIGYPKIRRLSLKNNLITSVGTKVFVFSCYDAESIRVAPELDFDYGLCIEYRSLDDLKDFRKNTGIKQPVQIANEEMIKALGITSYPALITVKENELEIQKGF